MKSIQSLAVWPFQRDDAGQGLAEYALILALIAITAILALALFGDSLANLMSYIGDEIEQST